MSASSWFNSIGRTFAINAVSATLLSESLNTFGSPYTVVYMPVILLPIKLKLALMLHLAGESEPNPSLPIIMEI